MEFTKSFEISPSTFVANVRLNVYSVERSLHFYRDLLGLKLMGKSSDDNAFLSPIDSNDKAHLLHLSRVGAAYRVTEREHWKAAHGFRKFYKTRTEQVMKPINVEITSAFLLLYKPKTFDNSVYNNLK